MAELLVRSRKPLTQPAKGEPPMDLSRIVAWRDKPTDADAARFAVELLDRTGPLVLDGVQYSLDAAGRIEATPVDMLGIIRQRKIAEEAAAAVQAARVKPAG